MFESMDPNLERRGVVGPEDSEEMEEPESCESDVGGCEEEDAAEALRC